MSRGRPSVHRTLPEAAYRPVGSTATTLPTRPPDGTVGIVGRSVTVHVPAVAATAPARCRAVEAHPPAAASVRTPTAAVTLSRSPAGTLPRCLTDVVSC